VFRDPLKFFGPPNKEQLVPYGYIGELLGPEKEAPEQVEVQENMLERFWRTISGEGTQTFSSLGFVWGLST
jgi:hypothetical protein